METRLTIGPPGTGKTTHLAEKVKEAVAKYGSHSVLIASLTRSAAAEIASRHLPLSSTQVGTLHAFAWRSCGNPEVAETSKKLSDFNSLHLSYSLGNVKGSLVEEAPVEAFDEKTRGQELFRLYTLCRCRLVHRERWRENVRRFAEAWEDWKRQANVLDFEDLIHRAAEDTDAAPGNPWIIYGDEAQDWSKSEWRLVTHWAERCHALVVVGDADQAIYDWRGADPEGLRTLAVLPEHRRVLGQSYRVPRQVHAASAKWISRVRNRFQAEYLPRDEEGECRRVSFTYKYPEALLSHARQFLQDGKTVMVLAACSYMLEPLKACLREQGTPFHNPYRRKRGDWNPLARVDRLLNYLRPDPGTFDGEARPWTWRELWSWLQIVESERCLLHGGKAGVAEMAGNEKTANLQVTEEDLASVLAEVPGRFDLEWLERHALESRMERLRYPIQVCRRHGGKRLLEKPLVVMGTVHSVKGGEASVVYLFPDISPQAMERWIRPGSREHAGIVRQFYVGMTRARERLFLCGPSGPFAVNW